MEEKRIIAIGGSAGSISLLLTILPQLSAGYPWPIVIVVHRKNNKGGVLESILKARCVMPVIDIEDKLAFQEGNIYVAPADYHLLVESDYTFALDASEKVNYSRPNINVAFESIADVYQGGAVGILLSGSNEDGAKGMKRIKEAGGFTIVQLPESSLYPTMPESAEILTKHHLTINPDEILAFLKKSN